MSVTISSRGQTVIPAEIRRRYGIKAGTQVEFIDTGKEIVIVPLPGSKESRSRGILKGVSTADLIAVRRKERRREHGRSR